MFMTNMELLSKVTIEYKLSKTIEKGSQSSIRIAKNKLTNKKVAVKIYKTNHYNYGLNEIKILEKLKHKNIINLEKYFKDELYIILILKYCKTDFFYYLQKTKLDENQCKLYFLQLSEAVNYCHSKNIIHRDIKLENMLLDEQNNLILADFGFSINYNGYMIIGEIGSPSYKSPEIDLYYNKKTDIWSMGIVLFLFFYNTFPWTNFVDINFEIFEDGNYKLFWNYYDRIKKVSDSVKKFFQKLCTINYLERYSIEDVLKDEFFHLIEI